MRLAQILRVDHAGELAAVHIYRGQRAVLDGAAGRSAIGAQLGRMEEQEARHLARFETLLNETRTRPTLLTPVWRAAAFALEGRHGLLGRRPPTPAPTPWKPSSRLTTPTRSPNWRARTPPSPPS